MLHSHACGHVNRSSCHYDLYIHVGADVGEQIDQQNMNVQTPLLSPSGDQTQRFNSQKFILQWLGIGYGYSEYCQHCTLQRCTCMQRGMVISTLIRLRQLQFYKLLLFALILLDSGHAAAIFICYWISRLQHLFFPYIHANS